MQLYGLDRSPFVRRVAISMRLMGFDFDHEQISVYRDAERFAGINPVIKAPTLILDDGAMLLESALILEYLERRPDKALSLIPAADDEYVKAQRLIGLALVAADKSNQIILGAQSEGEKGQPVPLVDRARRQMQAAYAAIEAEIAGSAEWLFEGRITQADITIACARGLASRFLEDDYAASRYPSVEALAERAEAEPVFEAFPIS